MTSPTDGPDGARAAAPKRDASRAREKILRAATQEFAQKGLDGARVDEIALASGVNKTLIYHYFGSKDQLFTAVLERMYATIRTRQSDLSIRDMDPEEGLRRLVGFTFDVWIEMPEFLRLLASENLHEAAHVRASPAIVEMYNPLLETIGELLARGARTGTFRGGVDPVDLYISISGLTAYYISHQHTLGAIFRTDLMATERLEERRRHVCDMILRYLRA